MLTPKPIVLATAVLLIAGAAVAEPDARMLRTPDVSATQIAFVYAGDVWVVAKEGGVAQRLSTPRGEESFPRFSPDGTTLAYSANYDGNTDIYTIPVRGGVPTRITHHPGTDRVLDWLPDGSGILFATDRTAGKDRFNQLYRVGRNGGLPEMLPVPYGEFGAISADGRTLAYMPISRDFRTWKRYRGGMAPDIWLLDLEARTSRNVTAHEANDGQPMWHGATLYFLSDRDENKRGNIWAIEAAGGQPRQVTRFTDHDVRFPAIGPTDIVFENGGRLYLLGLSDEAVREIRISAPTDRATLKPRVENVAKHTVNLDLSPGGKRVVVEARGELFSLPAEHGPVLNLTRSPGVAERFPALSPDGKTLAYFSDRSGEYELHLRPADGSGAERQVTRLGAGFRYTPFWSPDSSRVAFVDQAMRIHVAEVSSGKLAEVDRGRFMFHGSLDSFRPSWSPDSRWLAYARDLDSGVAAVFLYDTKSGSRHQVTSGFYDAGAPVFDPEGKYLYLLTAQTFQPSYGDLDSTFIYANATTFAALPLRADVPSPLPPRNDVEGAAEEEKKDEPAAKTGEKTKDDKSGRKGVKPVAIDFEQIERRLVLLPIPPGNIGRVQAVAGKLVYRRLPRTGVAKPEGEPTPVLLYDFAEREEKTILADADGFILARDVAKLLAWKGRTAAVVELKADQKLEKKVPADELLASIDPAAEWRQIFNDVWRLERDYFYDPAMHGLDWPAMRERYGALLADVVTRWDLNFVIGEMIAELNASHAYRSGGDLEAPLERRAGLLGCDFALEQGAYRITRIIDGGPHDAEVRAPLRRSGVNVREGDFLLAVNRMPIDTSKDPWAAFEGLAGKTVLLTVSSKPSLEGAREVLVETLESEARLRNLAWMNEKREKVEKATGGRVGYIYVPDTGLGGQTELVRQFLGQYTKDGLIIDERFNSGGQIPDRFIELLNRPLYNYWGVRDGIDWQWPRIAHVGPKAMLINGWSGSGGDAFPFYFKKAGLGPLIGTRTWGGLIGISGAPGLIDGGTVTVPTFGMYSTEGEWIIEGHGVEPDIEVIDDPALMADGGDPQLERAIEEVMKALAETPPARPAKPAYPNRAR